MNQQNVNYEIKLKKDWILILTLRLGKHTFVGMAA